MANKRSILFFFIVLLTISCKKNPFDYRTKYIGDWDFVNNWTSWILGGPVMSGTSNSQGKVEYGKKGFINVTFDNNSPSYFHELKVDREGHLSDSNGNNVGTISKTKLTFNNSGGSGMGGGGSSSISGTKK